LRITNSIELPPDIRSDEISLQTVVCSKCDLKGIAIYEESRRGRIDDDAFSHTGYQTDENSYSDLRTLIKKCPHPKDKNCYCETHKKLGEKNESGRCVGLSLYHLDTAFPIE